MGGQQLPGAHPSWVFHAEELSGTALGEGEAEQTLQEENSGEQEVPEAAENGSATSQESEAKQSAQLLE